MSKFVTLWNFSQYSSAHHILDVGSGLGGPARYLAHKTNCAVTALELQEDLHKEAENLTRRCNLQHKLSHMSGDFLQLDLGMFLSLMNRSCLIHELCLQLQYLTIFLGVKGMKPYHL